MKSYLDGVRDALAVMKVALEAAAKDPAVELHVRGSMSFAIGVVQGISDDKGIDVAFGEQGEFVDETIEHFRTTLTVVQ